MTRPAARAEAAALKLAMAGVGATRWRRFRRALDAPMAAQTKLLRAILAANATTTYGRRHSFARVDGYAAFRDCVPVTRYEDLQPLIEAQAATGETSLTAAAPVLYARTSGTTGATKLVPVTGPGLASLRATQSLFGYAQYRFAQTFAGRILAIAGAAEEARTARGIPIGSATGAVYAALPSVIRRRYVVPSAVMAIADYATRDYVVALLGLAAADVSALATANPSTLLRLQCVIEDNWDRLLADLTAGHVSVAESLGPAQQAAIAVRLKADPGRARALGRLAGPRFGDIWPGLKSVVTWTGGSCGYALAALRPQLPRAARVIEAGYHASECRGTINIDPRTNACVPALTATFFEFVACDAAGASEGPFKPLDEIEAGRSYRVFVTTTDGLYRYDMNDIVTVTGRVGATPTLAFVQKGRGVTSITGEKLAEAQVLAAMHDTAPGHGMTAPFFLLVADEAAAGYHLFVETARPQDATALAANVDTALAAANVEYAAKRASGRLAPLGVTAVRPGSADAYRRHAVAQGQRDAQFKVQHLQYRRDVDFDFTAHAYEALPS